jgi:hypothetical protein
MQNFAISGLSCPQDGHFTLSGYGRTACLSQIVALATTMGTTVMATDAK